MRIVAGLVRVRWPPPRTADATPGIKTSEVTSREHPEIDTGRKRWAADLFGVIETVNFLGDPIETVFSSNALSLTQKEANPSNFLLMHAMGPNVAGVIGSAVAAGFLLAMFGR